jgi:hypothetical protein
MNEKAKVTDLYATIADLLAISPKGIELFKDQGFKKKFKLTLSHSLKKAGFGDGIQVFVKNEKAKFTTGPDAPPNPDHMDVDDAKPNGD